MLLAVQRLETSLKAQLKRHGVNPRDVIQQRAQRLRPVPPIRPSTTEDGPPMLEQDACEDVAGHVRKR